jgi:hypothetical protein
VIRCAWASWRRTGRSGGGPEGLGEAHVEHLVGLVEHDHLDAVEGERVPLDVVDCAAGSGHDDVDTAGECMELAADRLSSVDGQHACAEVAAVLVDRLGDLHGEFAGRHEDEADGAVSTRLEALEHR